ncbi:hypothetical protein [Mycobacterium asiaticum]|uniref:hypothetical protein n=1 Tax=Mycobacterium asiaticum TaxID=1790 RepID=UPI000A940CA7|nr:hypothetical protein [Mycobacterium asiaticum]
MERRIVLLDAERHAGVTLDADGNTGVTLGGGMQRNHRPWHSHVAEPVPQTIRASTGV